MADLIGVNEEWGAIRAKLNAAVPYISDADAAALIAKMQAQPTNSRQVLINTSIAALKTNNLWGKIGWLSVMAAHDEQAGRLNWVNPNQSLSTPVPMQWIRDYAFKGDGASAYMSTGIAINAMPNFSQNSACIALYVPDNTGSSAVGNLDVGTSSSYITALSSTFITARANHTSAQGGAQSIAATTAFGLSYWSRQSGSDFYIGRNLVAPTQKTIASAALDTAVIQIGKVGVSSPGWSSKPLSLVLFGNMTAAEIQTFYSVFVVPYMTALGVPVP